MNTVILYLLLFGFIKVKLTLVKIDMYYSC